jgi:hypothetical protein
MKLHRNARLSVKGRELLVDRVENVAGDKLTGRDDCTQRRRLHALDCHRETTVTGLDRTIAW